MELKVNKNHKKADVSKMSFGKKVCLGLSGIGVVAFLFSGCCFQCFLPWTTDIPHTYEYSVRQSKEPICIYDEDLEKLTKLELQVKKGKDLSWLNKCKNLQELTLIFDKDNVDASFLKDINCLKSLKTLTVKSSSSEIVFDSNNFSFLDKECISRLTLEGVSLDCDFLEKFINLKYLSMSENFFNTCIDFTKFSKLEVLDLQNNHVYDIAMFLSNDSCKHLFGDDKVKVLYSSEDDVDLEVVCNNFRLSTFDISDSSTDREKLDEILIYVLDYLDYDPNLEEVKSQGNKAFIDRYYKDGQLYGALHFPPNSYGKAICGNYAALFTALANRVGLEAYYISGVGHAFNLVNIDGKYYYTDPTWLDGKVYNDGEKTISAVDAIRTGNGDKLDWYLEEPSVYHDDDHVPDNIPNNIQIKEIKTKGEVIGYIIVIGGMIFLLTACGLYTFLNVLYNLKYGKNKPKTKILKLEKEN